MISWLKKKREEKARKTRIAELTESIAMFDRIQKIGGKITPHGWDIKSEMHAELAKLRAGVTP